MRTGGPYNQKFNFQERSAPAVRLPGDSLHWAVLYSAADCRESSESCFGYYRRDHCFRCYRLLFGRFWIFRSRIPAGDRRRAVWRNVGRISDYLQKSRFNQLAEEMNAKAQQHRAEYSRDKMKEYLVEKRRTLSEAMEQMQKLEKERKEAEGRRNPLSESKNRLMEFEQSRRNA